MKNKNTEIQKLMKTIHDDDFPNQRWYSASRTKAYTKTINYLENISIAGLKRLVSDKSWNNLPTFTYVDSDKKRRSVVAKAISNHLLQYKKSREILQKNSVGLIALYTFDGSRDVVKAKISKRLFNNTTDARLKKRFLKYLNKKDFLKLYKKEKNKDVLRKAEEVALYKRIDLSGIKGIKCPIERFLEMPLTEIDIVRTLNWNFSREIWLIDKEIDKAELQSILAKIKLININSSKFDLSNYSIPRCLMHLLGLCTQNMEKMDYINNLDIPDVMTNSTMRFYDSGNQTVKERFGQALTSKWT